MEPCDGKLLAMALPVVALTATAQESRSQGANQNIVLTL